jgi:hypothetical protein
METAKLGDWAFYCCCLDAEQLKTQEQVEEANKELRDNSCGLIIVSDLKVFDKNYCSCDKPKGRCYLNEG